MISRINNLIYSDNEQFVQQGITLLLDLNLVEETYQNFKELILNTDWTYLTSTKSKFQCSYDMQYAVLFSLLKVLNTDYNLSQSLSYCSKVPFGLLEDLGLKEYYYSFTGYIVENLKRSEVSEFLNIDLDLENIQFKNCSYLKRRNYPNLTQASFTRIKWKFTLGFLKGNPTIESLELDSCVEYEKGQSLVLPSLKELKISRMVWDQVLEILKDLPHIESLHICKCTSFNSSTKVNLPKLKTLKFTGKNWKSFNMAWSSSSRIQNLIVNSEVSIDLRKVLSSFVDITYLSIGHFDIKALKKNYNVTEEDIDKLISLMDIKVEAPILNKPEWIRLYHTINRIDIDHQMKKLIYLLQRVPANLNCYRKLDGIEFNLILCPEGTGSIQNNRLKFKLSKAFFICDRPISKGLWALVINPSSPELNDETDKDQINNLKQAKSQVSWIESIKFCNALSCYEGLDPAYTIANNENRVEWDKYANGYRLPFEHEWDISFKRSLGMYEFKEYEHFNDIIRDKLHYFGTKVDAEWCNNVYAQLSASPYRFSPYLNSSRTVRGIDKSSNGDFRFNRTWYVSSHKSRDIGFRVVRSVMD